MLIKLYKTTMSSLYPVIWSVMITAISLWQKYSESCRTWSEQLKKGAVVVMIVWCLYFQLPMQSVPITTEVLV
jgi:hypothetical protein